MEEAFGIVGGPMGGGGGMMGGRGGGGGPMMMGPRGSPPIGGLGLGRGPPPPPLARPMSDHYMHYHHPKPRFFRPFYNVAPYYYPFYYYYPYTDDAYGRQDEEMCFCKDVQYKDKQVCVNGVCGTCAPTSICDECDDTVTCDKK